MITSISQFAGGGKGPKCAVGSRRSARAHLSSCGINTKGSDVAQEPDNGSVKSQRPMGGAALAAACGRRLTDEPTNPRSAGQVPFGPYWIKITRIGLARQVCP
jgi:hypothetical protein